MKIDDTPVYKKIREALANCLVNTDIYVLGGVAVKKDADSIIMENFWSIHIWKKQMLKGYIWS